MRAAVAAAAAASRSSWISVPIHCQYRQARAAHRTLAQGLAPAPLLHLDPEVPLGVCWRELGLPAEAAAWGNAEILDFFRVQQEKVVAFASGLQARLGVASCVSSLNELALVIIADEVPGRWILRRQ